MKDCCEKCEEESEDLDGGYCQQCNDDYAAEYYRNKYWQSLTADEQWSQIRNCR